MWIFVLGVFFLLHIVFKCVKFQLLTLVNKLNTSSIGHMNQLN